MEIEPAEELSMKMFVSKKNKMYDNYEWAIAWTADELKYNILHI